jgi:hypothetical protein
VSVRHEGESRVVVRGEGAVGSSFRGKYRKLPHSCWNMSDMPVRYIDEGWPSQKMHVRLLMARPVVRSVG